MDDDPLNTSPHVHCFCGKRTFFAETYENTSLLPVYESMITRYRYPVIAGIILLLLISSALADSSNRLISDNFSGSGSGYGSPDPGHPVLHPVAVMSWSDVTMISGKIRNFQKEFRYESGFSHE